MKVIPCGAGVAVFVEEFDVFHFVEQFGEKLSATHSLPFNLDQLQPSLVLCLPATQLPDPH
jgi:hypothetical protein